MIRRSMKPAAVAKRAYRRANPHLVKIQNAKRDPAKMREYAKKYYYKNHEANKKKSKERMKVRYAENPEKVIAAAIAYRKRNSAKVNARLRIYYQKRRDDPAFRLLCNLRRRMHRAIHGHVKSGSTVYSLGCSIIELRKYIECQWADGMNWVNYGRLWNIDHIMPLSGFDLSDPDQWKTAAHFTNLRPMFVLDNTRKGGANRERRDSH